MTDVSEWRWPRDVPDDVDREEAVEILEELQDSGDKELAHIAADRILKQFAPEDVVEAYDAIGKWYA